MGKGEGNVTHVSFFNWRAGQWSQGMNLTSCVFRRLDTADNKVSKPHHMVIVVVFVCFGGPISRDPQECHSSCSL